MCFCPPRMELCGLSWVSESAVTTAKLRKIEPGVLCPRVGKRKSYSEANGRGLSPRGKDTVLAECADRRVSECCRVDCSHASAQRSCARTPVLPKPGKRSDFMRGAQQLQDVQPRSLCARAPSQPLAAAPVAVVALLHDHALHTGVCWGER